MFKTKTKTKNQMIIKKKAKQLDVKNKKVFNFDDNWEVKIDTVKNCSKAPEKIDILISQLTKCKIDALMKEYKNLEWIAYLIGKEIVVEDIFIPEQKITSTTINDVICPEYNKLSIIGVIHSHNDMGSDFSSTDNDWINQNHNISICISNNSINGQFRWKTPCGALKIIKANVKQKIDIDFDAKKFINAVKKKIEKSFNYYSNEYGYGCGYDRIFSDIEKNELEKEVEELDFDKDKSLLQELEELEGTDNLDDKETN